MTTYILRDAYPLMGGGYPHPGKPHVTLGFEPETKQPFIVTVFHGDGSVREHKRCRELLDAWTEHLHQLDRLDEQIVWQQQKEKAR